MSWGYLYCSHVLIQESFCKITVQDRDTAFYKQYSNLLIMIDSRLPTTRSRLAMSAYLSPYSHTGAPNPHPNTDPYAPLRSSGLSTLEAMGYDPETMVERGVVWAEDQDPFGHVMQSQYMHFLGTCFRRVMESYDGILTEDEYEDMIHARRVVPVIRNYKLDIRRQVEYPDAVSKL